VQNPYWLPFLNGKKLSFGCFERAIFGHHLVNAYAEGTIPQLGTRGALTDLKHEEPSLERDGSHTDYSSPLRGIPCGGEGQLTLVVCICLSMP
jgi:hypothetical protein